MCCQLGLPIQVLLAHITTETQPKFDHSGENMSMKCSKTDISNTLVAWARSLRFPHLKKLRTGTTEEEFHSPGEKNISFFKMKKKKNPKKTSLHTLCIACLEAYFFLIVEILHTCFVKEATGARYLGNVMVFGTRLLISRFGQLCKIVSHMFLFFGVVGKQPPIG